MTEEKTTEEAQRQKAIDETAVAEMAHKVLGKRCIGDDDADCWVIAEQIVGSEWFAARMADAWDEGFTAAFYDPLAGSSAHDASESTRTNPYRGTEEAS